MFYFKVNYSATQRFGTPNPRVFGPTNLHSPPALGGSGEEFETSEILIPWWDHIGNDGGNFLGKFYWRLVTEKLVVLGFGNLPKISLIQVQEL